MSEHPKKKREATDRQGEPIKEPQELLTDALVLGLTAPTDAEVDRAVALAERVAALCSEFEIFAAKRDALTRVRRIRGAK
jgi:hypothetical protein